MSARYAALLVLHMSFVVLLGFAFAADAAEPVKEPFGKTPDGVVSTRSTATSRTIRTSAQSSAATATGLPKASSR